MKLVIASRPTGQPVCSDALPTIRAHRENGANPGVPAAFPGPTRPTYYCERF